MYPVVGKSAANWGMCSVYFADEFYTWPFAVPTLIVAALVSDRPCGADGFMQRRVAPESTMTMSCWGMICSCCKSGVGVYVRVVLQLKLASYNKCSLIGYLCITVCSSPHRHSSSLHAPPLSFISSCAHSFWSVIFLGSKYHEFLCVAKYVQPPHNFCIQLSPPVLLQAMSQRWQPASLYFSKCLSARTKLDFFLLLRDSVNWDFQTGR